MRFELECHSEILFMRQYRHPLKLRKIRTALDLLRDYPHHPEGHCRWSDRVFIPWPGGATVTLSELWRDTEPALQQTAAFVQLLEDTVGSHMSVD